MKIFFKVLAIVMSVILVILGISNYVKKQNNKEGEFLYTSTSSVLNKNGELHLTAHRGSNMKAPENSIPAYEIAIEKGYYAVETDVRLTKDGVWVVSHDSNINRCFNGYAEIEKKTYSELLKYRVDTGRNYWKYDLQIPTLAEYLDLFVGTGVKPEIELKTNDNKGIDEVISMLKERNLYENSIIISFNLSQVQYVHQVAPEMEVWYLVNQIDDQNISATKDLGKNAKLATKYDKAKEDIPWIEKSISMGVDVACWTVDSIEAAEEIYNAGVRYITSNNLINE